MAGESAQVGDGSSERFQSAQFLERVEIREGAFVIEIGLCPATGRQPGLDTTAAAIEVVTQLWREFGSNQSNHWMRLLATAHGDAIGARTPLDYREPLKQIRRQKWGIARNAKNPWSGSD